MKQRVASFILAGTIVLSAVACRIVSPPPAATITPTLTVSPTQPPTITPPCYPQLTSQAALQSAQERVEGLVPGARVTWVNEFGCNDLDYGWYAGGRNPVMRITDDQGGMVTIETERVTDLWDGIGRTTDSLRDNTGFLVLFRFEEGTSAPLCLMSGTFLAPNARRWGLGINSDTFQANLWEGWDGVNYLGPVYIGNVLRPDTWFYMLIRLDDHSLVTLRLWEKDNPENYTESLQQMPARWVGREWAAVFQVYNGRLDIDEYLELSFDTP